MHNKYFFDNFYMLQKTVKTNRKKISDTIGNANNSIIQNIFKFEETLEMFKELNESIEKVLKINNTLIFYGYPPYDNFHWFSLKELAKKYHDGNFDFIQFLNDYFDEVHIEYLKEELKNFDLHNNEKQILKNTIIGYELEQYDLIVPTLFARIEGLLYHFVNYKGKADGEYFNEIIDYIINNHQNKNTMYDEKDFEEIKSYYKTKLKKSFNFGEKEDMDLNRNSIMHGNSVNYGKKENAVKLFLHYEYLYYCLRELDDKDKKVLLKSINQKNEKRKKGVNKRKRKQINFFLDIRKDYLMHVEFKEFIIKYLS